MMCNIISSKSDIIINNFLKHYIIESKLPYKDLTKLLCGKFSKSNINKIKRGKYLFDIYDFIYITQKLNLDTKHIFKQMNL